MVPIGAATSPTIRSASPRLATKKLNGERRSLLESRRTATTTKKLPTMATIDDNIVVEADVNDK